MTSEQTTPQSLKSIIGVALIGLGLNGAACPVSHLLSAIAGKALGILPSLVLAAWQASQAFALDHQRLLDLLSQSVSFWALIDSVTKVL
ncbi:MAG TPA: hypothetical protein VGF61_00260 [Candidatus Acidoferrum sp.]|jgi:hypothetical protein